jgi:hypothetical protein
VGQTVYIYKQLRVVYGNDIRITNENHGPEWKLFKDSAPLELVDQLDLDCADVVCTTKVGDWGEYTDYVMEKKEPHQTTEDCAIKDCPRCKADQS